MSAKASRCGLVLGWLLCCSSVVSAQGITFDGKALTKFGTRKYKMTRIVQGPGGTAEREVGMMTLSVKVTAEGVEVGNVTRLVSPDGKGAMEYRLKSSCSADGKLSLRNAEFNVVRVGESDEAVVFESKTTVTGGWIIHTYSSSGSEETFRKKWVDGTLTEMAMFFLVAQLARKKGAVVNIDNVLSTPATEIKEPQSRTITCLGVDEEMSTEQRQLTKFVSVVKGEESGINYWVDQDGVLQRVQLNAQNWLDLIEPGDRP